MSQAGINNTSIFPPGAIVDSLTGNVGGLVGPDAGNNINILGAGGVIVTGNPGTNTLTITVGGGGFSWNETLVVGPVNLAASNGYISNNGALVTYVLPAVSAVGDVIRVTGKGAGGWIVTQGAGQSIQFGNVATTVGVGGSLASTTLGSSILIVCITANLKWNVLSVMSNLTIV